MSEWGQQHSISIYVSLTLLLQWPSLRHFPILKMNWEHWSLSHRHIKPSLSHRIAQLVVGGRRRAILKITFSSVHPWNGFVYSPFWWNLTTNVINPLASAQPRTILLFTFSIRLSLFFFFRGFDQSSSYAFIKKRTEAQNNGKLIFLFHRPMPSSYCVIYFSFCCNANVRHWNEKDDFAWKYLKWRKSIHNNKTKKWDPYLQPLRIVSGDSDVAIDFICGHA